MDSLIHGKRTYPCNRHFLWASMTDSLWQKTCTLVAMCFMHHDPWCWCHSLSQSKPNTPINHTNVFIITRESRLLIVGSLSDLLVVFLNGSNLNKMMNFGNSKWQISITSSAPETFKCNNPPKQWWIIMIWCSKSQRIVFLGQNSIIIVDFLAHATFIFCQNNSIILWLIVAFIWFLHHQICHHLFFRAM